MKRHLIAACATSGSRAAAILGAFLIAGCHWDEHPHAHGHDPKTAQITVWGERHEVFTEYRFPVAGQPVTFATHITDLRTFEPRRNGPITYLLRLADEPPIQQVVSAPSRDGIYDPVLTFPRAGDWSVSVTIPEDGREFTVACPAVRVFATEHEAQHAQGPEASEGISFLKEQQWNVQTRSEPVSTRPLAERVQVPGHARARPGYNASVPAPLAGQLALAAGNEFPVPGTHVRAGDVLAVLQPVFSDAAVRFVEIEAEAARADAVYKQSDAAYQRIRRLVAAQARTERELEEAEVALVSARARKNAAESLRATYASQRDADSPDARALPTLELRAPISGIVSTVSAGIGQTVTAEQVLFTILNPERIWIEAQVPEAIIARLEKAGDALVEMLDGSNQFFTVGEHQGQLVFSGLEVNPVTRSVPFIYEVNNENARLRVGQAVRLHVQVATAQNALAIPDTALVEEGGLFVAFVQVAGETFEKRALQLGIRDGQWVEVLSGITEGERVVTRGAYAIRLAAASAVIPAHGHTH